MSDNFDPRITLLYCGQGIAEGEHLPEGMKKGDGFQAKFVIVPCGCKVESVYLLKLFEGGSDGVVLVGCPKEECQFMIGSTRAGNRVRYVQSLLQEVGMDRDRLAFVEGINLSAEKYFSIAQEQASVVKPFGPNPVKMAEQLA